MRRRGHPFFADSKGDTPTQAQAVWKPSACLDDGGEGVHLSQRNVLRPDANQLGAEGRVGGGARRPVLLVGQGCFKDLLAIAGRANFGL